MNNNKEIFNPLMRCQEKIRQNQFDEALDLMENLSAASIDTLLEEISKMDEQPKELFKTKAVQKQIFNHPFFDTKGNSLLNRVCLSEVQINSNHIEYITELLLQAGADPNHVSCDGKSPLINSLEHWTDNIEPLLKHGAQPYQEGEYGTTAFFYVAVWHKSRDIELFLHYGTPINIQNEDGDTALIMAAESGEPEQIICLLKNGADPNIKNHQGHTVIDILNQNLKIKPNSQYSDNLAVIQNYILHQDIQKDFEDKHFLGSLTKNRL